MTSREVPGQVVLGPVTKGPAGMYNVDDPLDSNIYI